MCLHLKSSSVERLGFATTNKVANTIITITTTTISNNINTIRETQ